jgi:peptidoglycan/xylan/chitin deacetylase (PgdA/CDA1 family)
MKVVAFVYHDVVASGEMDSSGFPGRAPARYKLSREQFQEHLEAIAVAGRSPSLLDDQPPEARPGPPVVLTFDDGGASAVEVGERLAQLGWPAYFFIVSNCIGRPAFLDVDGIRALRAAGHAIGSHSLSHPVRISDCDWDRQLDEWRGSAHRLSEILEEPVTVASVPGGFYSEQVARAAAAAGIETLFTSEPKMHSWTVDGCLVLGRYSITRTTSAATARRLAEASLVPRVRQATSWSLKKYAKRLPGDPYGKLRRAILERQGD